jgi:hypothetical protein
MIIEKHHLLFRHEKGADFHKRLFYSGQRKVERRPFADFPLRQDPAPMSGNDPLDRRQTDPLTNSPAPGPR